VKMRRMTQNGDVEERDEPQTGRSHATRAPSGRLPDHLTSFVGRQTELEDLRTLLDRSRLLTLTGSGGCGKTRLACAIAVAVEGLYVDGAWWVDLERLAEPERVGSAALDSLGVRDIRGTPPVERLATYLAGKNLLLILDNCEHVLDACAELLDPLLRTVPGLRVIASSREPLGVSGEVVWKVPPLAVPSDPNDGVDTIGRFDAVQLFVDRAMASRPNFELSETTAPLVAQICSRLDGIPLAIELAAARTRVMTVEQILTGLEHRFRLLTGGVRTTMARHQTLEASVEWSHDLLTEPERILFRRLSVFTGWLALSAAEQVCSSDDLEEVVVLDVLSQLVDKSMVLATTDDTSQTRYRLLETMRHFARDELRRADETAVLRHRHTDYYVRYAEEHKAELEQGRPATFAEVEAEHDNISSALEWALASDRPDDVLRMVGALALFWTGRGHYTEGQALCERALAACSPEPSAVKARALWALALTQLFGVDVENGLGIAKAHEALDLARAVEDERIAFRASAHQPMVEQLLGSQTAEPALVEAAAAAKRNGDDWFYGLMLIFITYPAVFFRDETERMQPFITELEGLVRRTENPILDICLGGVRGACAMSEGRLEEAGTQFERALRLSRKFEDSGTTIFMVDGFTEVRFYEARFDEAREILETQIEHMARSTPGRVDLLRAKLAITDLLTGNVTNARDSLGELAPLMAGFGHAKLTAAVHTRLGQAEALLGDLEDAKAHLDQAIQIARDTAMPTMTVSALVQRGRVARTEGAIAESADLFHEGLQVAVDRRLRPLVAECIESLASLAVDAEAARLFGAADAMRTAMGMSRPPIDIPAYEADIDTARARLGPDTFDEAYHAGQNLSDDDAIAYARRMRTGRKRPLSGWASLTPTELQVVALAAQGLSNVEIGKKLFTSAGTAKTHLSHVYAKLSVANRAELAALAVRHGV